MHILGLVIAIVLMLMFWPLFLALGVAAVVGRLMHYRGDDILQNEDAPTQMGVVGRSDTLFLFSADFSTEQMEAAKTATMVPKRKPELVTDAQPVI